MQFPEGLENTPFKCKDKSINKKGWQKSKYTVVK